jgi:hypothetical protein
MKTTIQDNSEAFDIAIALYNWCAENHEGQNSDQYAIMSELVGTHNMSNIPEIDDSTELQYNNLDDTNFQEIADDLFYYLDNEWENNRY